MGALGGGGLSLLAFSRKSCVSKVLHILVWIWYFYEKLKVLFEVSLGSLCMHVCKNSRGGISTLLVISSPP